MPNCSLYLLLQLFHLSIILFLNCIKTMLYIGRGLQVLSYRLFYAFMSISTWRLKFSNSCVVDVEFVSIGELFVNCDVVGTVVPDVILA
jgi:hypothetical protein